MGTEQRRQQRKKTSTVRPPPGTPQPCDNGLIGKTVPGRRGGVVKACAVPPRAHPRRRDVFVVPEGRLFAEGHTMPASRARRRIKLRELLVQIVKLDSAYLYDAHMDFRRSGLAAPTGLEFPHAAGSSRCDPEHPVWRDYAEARDAAAERAAAETEQLGEGDEADEAYTARMIALMREHPSYAAWQSTADNCARQFFDRQERRRAKSDSAAAQRAALKRRVAQAGRGVDERDVLGGYLSEELDALTEKKWRPKAAPRALRAKAHPKAKKPTKSRR